MTLAHTQRAFAAYLRGGRSPRLGAQARAGIRIYRNTYRAQLAACLEESFPHTLAWIGGAGFRAAVVAHVARVPPSSWTLDAYARDFPETLCQLYPTDPEVAELAVLERGLGDAFVGADATPVTVGMLGDIDWDRAVLRFTPTLDMIEATTNAAAIWSALAASERPPAAELLPQPAALLVWRRDMVARFRVADGSEHHALLLARASATFSDLCASLIAARGERKGIEAAGGYLASWLADGMIVDIEGDD